MCNLLLAVELSSDNHQSVKKLFVVWIKPPDLLPVQYLAAFLQAQPIPHPAGPGLQALAVGDRMAVHGHTTFSTPRSLWELQQYQVLKLVLQLITDRRQDEPLGL